MVFKSREEIEKYREMILAQTFEEIKNDLKDASVFDAHSELKLDPANKEAWGITYI